MNVHRTLDGGWAECTSPTCELLFHLPDLTPAEAAALPMHVLLPLLAIVQPPSHQNREGTVLFWRDTEGRPHRDYDLPAVITTEGSISYWRHGLKHRGGGKPAIVRAGIMDEYWVDGERIEGEA